MMILRWPYDIKLGCEHTVAESSEFSLLEILPSSFKKKVESIL